MRCKHRFLTLAGLVLGLLILAFHPEVSRILRHGTPRTLSATEPTPSTLSPHASPHLLPRSHSSTHDPHTHPQPSDNLDSSTHLAPRTPARPQDNDTPLNSHQIMDRMVLSVVCCGERVNETQVMLKSAAVLSHSQLTLIIFTEEQYKDVFTNMYLSWPLEYRERIKLDLRDLTFPEGYDWRKLFKPCASQRLFMPSVLTDIDALLYVDTDVLFLAPVEELWRHFAAFNASQMAAMAPEHEDLATGWYNRFAKHPYYGRLGVNSGVMLMNLTRLRSFGWGEYLSPIYKNYRTAITWGDQDIINIIFHFHPDKLYVYGCEYNLRPDHCMYMSVCRAVERRGVLVLHGNRGTFHSAKQPAFRAVYQAWEQYPVGGDLRQELYYPMQRYLVTAPTTNCGRLHHAFLKHLASTVRLR